MLRLLEHHLRPGMRTVETGEGVSTILFAISGVEHLCISPNDEAIQRIRDFCAAYSVSLERVRFEVEASELVLPRLELGALDLVLLDGGHGFPTPFIDWYYAASALRPGGLLVVDDTQLWTAGVLNDFLRAEPGWSLEHELPLRSAVFRRQGDAPLSREWTDQPFVYRRSLHEGSPAWLRRVHWWGAMARGRRFDLMRERMARRLRFL